MNPATCNRKNGQSLASIMDDSAIRCNEILESYGEGTNFNEKKVEFLLASLLITIALLIAISIDCYLIKYQAKQKHHHFTTQIMN